jgi:hypothetical protein
MARPFFFALAFIGIGLLNSPAEALDAAHCESRNADCIGRCANPGGGVYHNRCMSYCDRQVTTCLVHAHMNYCRVARCFVRVNDAVWQW